MMLHTLMTVQNPSIQVQCYSFYIAIILKIADELAIDYQFTFNLSKSDDKYLTGINFKNTPTKMDVDFSITCSVPAKVSPKMASQFLS